MVLLERFTKVKNPGSAERIFVPFIPDVQAPATSFAVPATAPAGPRQLPPGPVQAIPGALYRATVNVSFPLSIAASASKVSSEAQKQGFTGVSVSSSKPAGWFGSSGDYYVSGTYVGQPKVVDRSAAGGQVKIIDVWQG